MGCREGVGCKVSSVACSVWGGVLDDPLVHLLESHVQSHAVETDLDLEPAAKREHLESFYRLSPGSQGQNMALTVAYVPHSLDHVEPMLSNPTPISNLVDGVGVSIEEVEIESIREKLARAADTEHSN